MLLFPVEARSHGRLIGHRADGGRHHEASQHRQAMAAPVERSRCYEAQGMLGRCDNIWQYMMIYIYYIYDNIILIYIGIRNVSKISRNPGVWYGLTIWDQDYVPKSHQEPPCILGRTEARRDGMVPMAQWARKIRPSGRKPARYLLELSILACCNSADLWYAESLWLWARVCGWHVRRLRNTLWLCSLWDLSSFCLPTWPAQTSALKKPCPNHPALMLRKSVT